MSHGTYPSDNQDKYMLRLPDGMREQLKDLAKANARSMNAEIIVAIERHLMDCDASPSKPYNARLDTFVAAALSGLLARGSDSMDLAEAGRIGEKMLELMEKTEAESKE